MNSVGESARWTPWRDVMPSKPVELVLLALTVLGIAGSIFVLDVIQPRPIAILYTVAILIAAGSGRRSWVTGTAAGVTFLTMLSYFLVEPDGIRCAIRIVGIAIVTSLILRNMTASKLLREQAVVLDQAQSDLARAARLTSLGQLTASIAHEVNQPISSILANGQAALRWLKRDTPDVAAVTASLEKIVGDARRAGGIITSVQMLVRNEVAAGTPQDLNDIIKESLGLLNRELDRGSIQLSLELSRSVALVHVDRIQIQQVVINLAMNAVQAMRDIPGSERRLRVVTVVADGECVVTISDTGPGIDPAVRDRLFLPFNTSKAEGMGLGLSICASIMARQGGRISAASGTLSGATFTFALPLHAPAGGS